MAVNRRIEDIPVSLEAMRRKVMLAVLAVERETDIFRERYMSNTGESDRWMSFISDVCHRTGKSVSQLEDYKDLDPLLVRLRGDQDVTRQPEYNQVRRMCERGKMFEYIAFSLRNDLYDAYDKNLQKYCLSFEPEAHGEELQSVTEYENKVIEWDKTIRERLEVVDDLLDESDKYKTSMEKYISGYSRVLQLMDESCKAMVKASIPMKKWISADSSYARKVQEEINIYNRRKMEHRDIIRQQEFNRDQLGLKLKRRAWFTVKIERMLVQSREEKRHFKRREVTIRNNYINLEHTLQNQRNQLEDVKSRLKNRKENSPTVYNYLIARIEDLRADVRKIEARRDLMEAQMTSLRHEQQRCQKDMDRLEGEAKASLQKQDAALDELQQQEEDIALVRDDIRSLDRKIVALKRIREIKLHSDTVKKIYHYGYNPGQMADIKGRHFSEWTT